MCTDNINDILSDRGMFSKRLKTILDQRRRRLISKDNLRVSAVLIPLCWDNDHPCMLLTKRSMNVEHHKGEISFPGGSAEPHDRGLVDTALRESFEEIGLAAKDVEVFGMLDDHISILGYHITPVVGMAPYPYDFRINSESETLLYVPLKHAFKEGTWMAEKTSYMGKDVNIYYLSIEGGVVWGATARILKHFVDLVCGRTIGYGPVNKDARAWVEAVMSKQSFYRDLDS